MDIDLQRLANMVIIYLNVSTKFMFIAILIRKQTALYKILLR